MYFNCGLKRSLKCMFLIVLSNLCTNKHASHAINIKYIDLYPSCSRHLPIICRLIVDPRNDQGPVSRKSRELFGPEKPFVKLRTAYSVKLIVSYAVKGIKITRASRRLRFEVSELSRKRPFLVDLIAQLVKHCTGSQRSGFESLSGRNFQALFVTAYM